MILVDSTKYITWMRGGKSPVALLAPQLKSGQLVSCGIVRLEVLRGVIQPRVKDELAEFFDLVTSVPLDARVVERATELAWSLDRKGLVLPSTDLIIAAAAAEVSADVITEDPHFAHIPGIRARRDI